jgi:hypothetical protein
VASASDYRRDATRAPGNGVAGGFATTTSDQTRLYHSGETRTELPWMKVREVIELIERAGWRLARTRGAIDSTSTRRDPAW